MPLPRGSVERRLAATVVAVFLLAGSAWVFLTDLLLYTLVDDPITIARVETAKGGMFVVIASFLLYVVTSRSVAQLSRAHATISAVLDSIGDGVLLLGADRRIAYANPAAVRMLRARTARDLAGMDAPEFSRRYRLSYPDGRIVPPHQYASQRVFDQGGTLNYKAVLRPPGAAEVVFSCTASAVRTGVDDPIDRVVSVMHDVTATEQLERLRDGLFAAAAHAVKTPIAIVKSTAQVLASTSPDACQAARTIERQCARVDRLVENVLVLSRFRSGTLRLHHVLLAFRPLVESAVLEAARLAPGRDIRADCAAAPRISADHERITMVLRNVMHAALRSSRPSAPITVRVIEADGLAQAGVRYLSRPPDELAGHDALEARDGGGRTDYDDIGVSRYVTAMMVEAHGGTLSEEVAEGATTVWVRLPAYTEAQH